MIFVKNFQRSKGNRSGPIPEKNDMKKERHPQSNRSQLNCRRMSHKKKLVIAVRKKTSLNQKGAKVRPRAASQQERQRPREDEVPAHCKQNCVPRKAFIRPAAGARTCSDTKAPNRIIFHQSTCQQTILRNLPHTEGKNHTKAELENAKGAKSRGDGNETTGFNRAEQQETQ